MNLRDLEYLVALDEERHFHRAAERCHVSQPTLSGQLKKLEEQLGVQLVERTSRQVAMTAAGQAVAVQARRVLAETRAVTDVAQSFRDPAAGDLNLGLIPTIGPYLLPLFMPRLHERYPRLRLFLHEYQTSVLLEKLREGELDLAILALPVETGEFAEVELFTEPFRLAVPLDDPLAVSEGATLDDLHGREVLLLEEGHCLRGQALEVCVTAGADEYRGFRANSLEMLRHMVGEGLGITLMPELAVPRIGTMEAPVDYLAFRDSAPSRRVGLLHRRGSHRGELFADLAELIRQEVPPVMDTGEPDFSW